MLFGTLCPLRSFYPGLASAGLPAIGAGANATTNSQISAPDGFAANSVDTENGNERGTGGRMRPGRRISASRPTRVVGVLDHPVTPMPPVSSTLLLRGENRRLIVRT